jgi:uncharacterized membrane protein
MEMRQSQSYRNGGSYESHNHTAERIATGLGWFSVGLGIAEVIAPGAMANMIGVRNEAKTRTLLRTYGLRELAAGIGILTQPRPAGWVWSRVAGDAVDLASLGSALQSNRANKVRVAAATAAVIGVTALDVLCGQQLSTQTNGGERKKSAKVVRTIIVERSPEETYQFWRNFENLPKFMTHLDSVRTTGDRRTHWTANGPAGTKIEWDAEIVTDEPNRLIAWRSLEGSKFTHSGSVRFEKAPGNRGTLVRVEMEPGSSVASKVLGADLGRRISHDLRNFKQVLEVGEVTQSDASIHPGMHAAQPATA